MTGSIGAEGSVDDGWDNKLCAGGGWGPPRTTVLRKPEFCNASMSFRWNFESGMEVRPRRAREAFWRWEQVFARWTRDILSAEKEGGVGGRRMKEGGRSEVCRRGRAQSSC